MPTPIVDLFAGPGGLGEGFSSLNDGRDFRIAISAEMDPAAHETLRLRAFYRLLRRAGDPSIHSYYDFCNFSESKQPYSDRNKTAWAEAGEEAQRLVLGNAEDNQRLDQRIRQTIANTGDWVLIGGPPCQAYSLVGRVRNQGKTCYRPEDDHRHFLYREYLRIIKEFRPAVFVMENVKGILSSKVSGKRIFHDILRDLSAPDAALGSGQSGSFYRIHSLVCDTHFEKGMDPDSIDSHDFIIRAEEHGLPQARHRVILLGVREDITRRPGRLTKSDRPTTLRDVIEDLPKLRSTISRTKNANITWDLAVDAQLQDLAIDAIDKGFRDLGASLQDYSKMPHPSSTGGLRIDRSMGRSPRAFGDWYADDQLQVHLNHESRGHMLSDLRRYGFAATVAEVSGRSPKGNADFNLRDLRPNHQNWDSGKFSDRFRVQLWDRPSTTVTSHIAKDGHYFIHPDPSQCRSLTVREAARLQTFPDNYFFQGNRTQQYTQVGNAVPPLLAKKIASIVKGLIS